MLYEPVLSDKLQRDCTPNQTKHTSYKRGSIKYSQSISSISYTSNNRPLHTQPSTTTTNIHHHINTTLTILTLLTHSIHPYYQPSDYTRKLTARPAPHVPPLLPADSTMRHPILASVTSTCTCTGTRVPEYQSNNISHNKPSAQKTV